MDTDSFNRRAFTLKEFCKAYSISRSYAYKEIKARRLVVKNAGRRVLVLRTAAEQWAAALPSSDEAISPEE